MTVAVDESVQNKNKTVRQLSWIAIESIRPNPYQPRKQFEESALDELASSICQFGLLTPITVRRMGLNSYELIAGERRLRACKKLGHTHIDAIVMPAFEQDTALIALIENIQREELHFFEEAEAYQALIADHGLTQEEMAQKIGKSTSAIANKLRVAKLPATIKEELRRHDMSERHARALLRLPTEEFQRKVLDVIISKHLSVKDTEQLIEKELNPHGSEIAKRHKKPIMRTVYRDHRILVNALMDVVRQMKDAGVNVGSEVSELEEKVIVTVCLPKLRRYA